MNQTFNLNFLEAHSYKFCHFRNWPWPIYLSIRTYSYMYVVLSNWLQRKIHNGLLSIERERARQPQHLIWHLLFHESQGQGIPKKITSRLYFNTYIHYIYFFHFFVSPRKNLKSVCQNAMKQSKHQRRWQRHDDPEIPSLMISLSGVQTLTSDCLLQNAQIIGQTHLVYDCTNTRNSRALCLKLSGRSSNH